MNEPQDLRYINFSSSENWWEYDQKWTLLKLIGEGERVLDVGCSYGEFGRLLKKKNCRVDGVENYEPAVLEARKVLDNVFSVDLNDDAAIDTIAGKYSAITFIDVLEHCVSPAAVLRKFKDKLTPEGRVYISVPNIANFRTRWAILRGNFDYQKYGVMDETHLRFFTRKTALELVASSFSRVREVGYTPAHNRLYRFMHLWPELFALQFVIEGRP